MPLTGVLLALFQDMQGGVELEDVDGPGVAGYGEPLGELVNGDRMDGGVFRASPEFLDFLELPVLLVEPEYTN